MPLRRRLKKARDYVQQVFSSPAYTRPSTPTSAPLGSDFPARDSQQLDDPDSNPSAIPIHTQTPTYSALGLRLPPNETSDSPGGSQQAQQSSNPIGATKNESQPEEPEATCAGPTSTRTGVHETERMVESLVPDQTSIRWKSLNQLVNVLAPVTNVFGPIKEVADIFIDCVDKCEMTGAAKAEYETLRLRLEVLFHDLQGYLGEGCSPMMTSSMESLCKSIKEELTYIDAIAGLKVTYGDYPSIRTCQCGESPRSKQWTPAPTECSLGLTVYHLHYPPVQISQAPSLKRRGCTQGTRVDVLAGLLNWVYTTGNGGVYWLNGMAGTGKTTIAYSLCEQLDTEHKLAASFFCSRLQEECRKVDRIIPSIAYQLARFSRPFQSAICAILEKDPDIHESIPEVQFHELLVKPLLEVERTLPEGMTVVIDALDECEDKWSTGHILDILLSESASLPIRFIVSSRPEPEIRDRISEGRVKSRLVLHELDKDQVHRTSRDTFEKN
ncbi:hypothetical protein OPQ81_008494 [Rhizoctonia solani]|nr:hypothetical protein OPQ81_008494 [Rhizoctonia solani]